ncbi:MAG TPA: MFS transporter [Stellaceae bacterium]|nr:MFS transporter [Stellaceae bacterium]
MSSAAYGLLYTSIGWRGLLWLGILPALTVVYVRSFVKEPPVWVENRRRQRAENREVRLPLFSIFKRSMIGNTLLACWWMAGGLVAYYSINGMFATHLQKDLGLSPALIATPIIISNAVLFLSSGGWGWLGDRIGRRWTMIIPGLLGIPWRSGTCSAITSR